MATYTLRRGDTWSQTFPIQDKDTGELLSLIEDAGPPVVYASARMDVRHKTTRALAFTLDSEVGEGHGGLTMGEYTVLAAISAEQSALLSGSTKYAFDIEVTWADGTVQSTETHVFDVEQDYTYV